MAISWNLGGLSLPELIRRTIRESWTDEVFGQAGCMAFYHFLAIFPILFVSLALLMRAPHLRDSLANPVHDLSSQVLPAQLLKLLQSVADEQSQRAHARVPVFTVLMAVLWAAFNATWAMIHGLNNAYEVEEDRPLRTLAIIVAGLSLSLAATGCITVLLIFCTRYVREFLNIGTIPLHLLEWLILIVTLSFSFSILYRFAPNLRDHEWQWTTPGALCALLLWVAATFGARLYFDHINDYSRSYGHLNGAVMLLLWLYISNGAILIGGEMNSEIEKAAKGDEGDSHRGHSTNRKSEMTRSPGCR